MVNKKLPSKILAILHTILRMISLNFIILVGQKSIAAFECFRLLKFSLF